MQACYQVKSTAIIHELLDNEIILANLDTGIYYSIQSSGVPLWQMLIAGHTIDSIATKFINQYPEQQNQIMSDIKQFIEELLNEDILQHSTNSSFAEIHFIWESHYHSPRLEKYQDMQALLMLDPIHEVDEQGWPVQQ